MATRRIAEMEQLFRMRIYFDFRESLPVDVLTTVLNQIETAIYQIDTEQWKAAAQILIEYGLSQEVLAVDYRREEYKGKTLQIEHVRDGSILVELGLTGITYWLLDATLGQTFKESWKRTDAHGRILELLLRDPFQDARVFFQRINAQIVKARAKREISKVMQDVQLNYEPDPDDGRPMITVVFRPTRPMPDQFR